jgi:class 3 adenylate cyclase/tetratricopeptide (TPR) repeat protein/tRNA A-37 threonylcarbamoyl transferase component Bud32
MTCASCGYENPSDARFCAGCGVQLAQQPPATGPSDAPGAIRDAPKQLAAGRYRLNGYLGEGARKVVYRAQDSALQREVAIAMLKTDDLDRAGRHQLQREAQAMARLGDHPNVVSVFDIGDDDGEPYIVSQYMAGGSLDKRLEDAVDNRLPLDDAIEVADCMAAALEHAHGRGVVHRDLKPSNVWLTADDVAQLGDFGLAFSADRTRLTRAGAIVGTVSYMAPEQALGNTPDASSDLYSLGALLYEMVTGRPPFVGDTAVSVISQHTSAEPVAPSQLNPEVPQELDAVVLKLLEKDPDERYADASALRAALAEARVAAERSAAEDENGAEGENPVEALAEGVFVGREKEVEHLRGALDDALAARGRLMMLVGEPGIGKTRTAQELTTYAQARGARVLVGRAYEGEGAPAYWPWVQVARAYMEGRPKDELKADMGPGAVDIAQVIGEVRGVLPGPDFDEPANAADSEQARFRLFDSVTTFLRNAAKREPLVIVLDDLHWADTPSLLLLEFMARELGGARLLIIGTYRDVELGRKHPLSKVLAELARESLVDRVLLRGLTQQDVARFIEMTASIRPPERLVRTVHEETEGNPFFVSEIVSLLASEGHLESGSALTDVLVTIPQGVREVVGRRLDRLSDQCNWVLSAACVLGRDFAIDVLAPVVCDEAADEFPDRNADDLTRERLLEVLDEAVSARVLQTADMGRYMFSHALVRESLYEELGVTRRVRLHRRVGETIENVFGGDSDQHLEQLAHHFLQAQELDKAIDYSIHAAGRAMSLMAYEDGATLYDRALQALDLRGGVSGKQRAELLIALGDALARAGEGQRAKETFFRAAEAARSVGAQDQLARAALGVANKLEIGLVEREIIELVEEALAGCGDEPSAARAELLASLAMALYFDSRERADELSAEAVEMARSAADEHVLAHALGARHFALWDPERLDERLAVSTELIEVAGKAGDLDHKVEGRGLRLIDLLEMGDIRGADAEMEAYGREANELRQPNYLRIAAIRRSMRAILAGRFDEAERMFAETPTLDRAKRLLEPNTVQAGAVVLFELRRLQGRLSELRSAFETFSKEYPAVPAWRAALALVYSEVGATEDARHELRDLARDDIAALGRDANWLVGMVCISLTAIKLRERAIAATAYEQMLPYAERNVVVGGGWSCEGSASLYLGYLAAFLQRFEAAERHFRDSLRMNERIAARPFVAETQMALAELIAERDGSAGERRAVELADISLEAARDIGMAALVERAFKLKMQFQGIDTADMSTSIDAVASAVGSERPDLTTATGADGTVTIMFSDIESSTEMTERFGDRRWIELLREHNRLVREELAAHEGFEVKSQGDGFMVAFASASRAVECAAAIQRAFARHADERPDEAIRVRIGLHTGEAIRERDDFFGRNVILAARIAAKANGGEVLVSSLLKELTEAEADVRFGEPRELSLKGLSGTYQVHAVDWEGLVAGAAG